MGKLDDIYDSFPPELKALAQEYGVMNVIKAERAIESDDATQIKNFLDANRKLVQEKRLENNGNLGKTVAKSILKKL